MNASMKIDCRMTYILVVDLGAGDGDTAGAADVESIGVVTTH